MIFFPVGLGEIKPLDTPVNSEIWLYFAKQKNPKKITFSVEFSEAAKKRL